MTVTSAKPVPFTAIETAVDEAGWDGRPLSQPAAGRTS